MAHEDDMQEALDIIMDLVANACGMTDGTLDSQASGTNANALEFLARHGKVVIDHDVGRRVMARWKPGAGEEA